MHKTTTFLLVTLPTRLFSDVNVSQCNMATYARSGWIFNNQLTTNLPRNLPVKKLENQSCFDRIMVTSLCPLFLAHPVGRLNPSSSLHKYRHANETRNLCIRRRWIFAASKLGNDNHSSTRTEPSKSQISFITLSSLRSKVSIWSHPLSGNDCQQHIMPK